VVVLDPDSGELRESRFEPSRQRLDDWAMEWKGRLAAVAIESDDRLALGRSGARGAWL
jgi:hypothetical protein